MIWNYRSKESADRRLLAYMWQILPRLSAYLVKSRNLKLIRASPLFDQAWYLAKYPEVATAGMDPALHYLTRGAAAYCDPGPAFNTAWYLTYYSDVAHAGVNPLVHYVRHGANEGRHRHPLDMIVSEVSDAALECRKIPSSYGEIALFVTHSTDDRLKAHVQYYLEALCRHGISPVLIVAADSEFGGLDDDFLARLGGFYVRQNVGYDFAAWAHVLRTNPQLFRADILYLINDSMIGPLNGRKFENLLQRLRASISDVIGLTDSYEQGWHIQSYFIALKRGALRSQALRKFIREIKSLPAKRDVTNVYELHFAPTMRRAGLTCEVLFPATKSHNPVLVNWHSLITAGMPFIKLATIRDASRTPGAVEWRKILQSERFDYHLAEQVMSFRP